MSKKKGVKKMATQLAPTPTVYGAEAQKIIQAAREKTSDSAKRSGSRLVEYYSKFEKKKG